MGYPLRDKESDGHTFGRRDFGKDRGLRRPQMHKAVCSSCGKDCDLPFKPTGDRPVYCRECFAKNGGGERKESFNRDNRDTRGGRDFPRPAFNKFTPENRPQTQPSPQLNEQLAAINSKLDRLIKLLTPATMATKIEDLQKTVTTADELSKTEKAVVVKKKKSVKKSA